MIAQWGDFLVGVVKGRTYPEDKSLAKGNPDLVANCPAPCLGYSTLQNATVTLNGQPISSGQTVTLPTNTLALDFTVKRVTLGQSTTVPFTIVDGCGEWQTFVGGGPSAGF